MDMLEALMENKFYRPDVYVYSEDISGKRRCWCRLMTTRS